MKPPGAPVPTIGKSLGNTICNPALCQVLKQTFHGSNRGSNPRGDAINLFNRLARKSPIIWALGFPASSSIHPSVSRVFPSNPECIGKQLGNELIHQHILKISPIPSVGYFSKGPPS